MKTLNITKTAEFHAGEGNYTPVKRFSVNERINYRGLRSPYHICNNSGKEWDMSPKARKERYEVNCLEKGLRPYGYPDKLWEQYLRDVRDEEHFNKCDAKNAWMYEF